MHIQAFIYSVFGVRLTLLVELLKLNFNKSNNDEELKHKITQTNMGS